MPFFPGQPQNNEGFQRGWNMVMNLYGQQRLQEQSEAQEKRFQQQFGLQKQQFEEQNKLRDIQLKSAQEQLKEAQRKNEQWEGYVEARKKEKDAGKLTPKREGELRREHFPLQYAKETPEEKRAAELEQTYRKELIKEAVRPQGYKPQTEEEAIRLRRAGATNINIGQEKFDIQKNAEASRLRDVLVGAKGDENIYASQGFMFNNLNTQNEVAYWDTRAPGALNFKGTKILRLPSSAIKEGWTPQEIQRAATATGLTVEEVLIKNGILK